MQGTVLVTGGSGFIGSAFIRACVAGARRVVNIDSGTYASDPQRIQGTNVETIDLDVTSGELEQVMLQHKPDVVVHFAAETHVTRSESDPELFHRTNVEGTRNVLAASERLDVSLCVHVSTDEVYGSATETPFVESDKRPGEGLATSPYARSKALADDLALEWSDRLPVIVVRPTNCFGPWQHPEKAIPRWTIRALQGRPIPVWGDGGYVRDWMYVDDACRAIQTVVSRGTPGSAYNVGPQEDVRTNLEIAQTLALAAGAPEGSVYLTAYDRPMHDRRYSVDASKLRALGWTPTASLTERLLSTVDWYRNHHSWWEPLVADAENLYSDETPRVTT